MADVTLAECNGNIWLVGGEQHVGALLFNSLPPEVTVEIVQLESAEQVRRLWLQNCGEPSSPSDPMLINPKIADRVRRTSPKRMVFFSQWSAMMDDEAVSVIASAANWLLATPALGARLVEYVDPDAVPGVAELSRLRLTLVREKLAGFGVDRSRLTDESRLPEDTVDSRQDSQRIGIEMEEPG